MTRRIRPRSMEMWMANGQSGVSNRRGASLTEVIVVISIASGVMGMAGVVFHRLFRSEQTAARSALIELSTSRLADQFRRDVHSAVVVQRIVGADDAEPILELKTKPESQRIVYASRKNLVERVIISSEQIVSRETYRLPECKVTFPDRDRQNSAAAESSNSQLVTLRLDRPHSVLTSASQVSRPLHPLMIEAELGRDDRLIRSRPRVASKDLREVTP